MRNLLINIHGFLSSSESDKVIELRRRVESSYSDVEFVSPRLPNTPKAAVELIETLISQNIQSYAAIALVGHSMGGYFATYLAAKYNIRAVLVNPVVRGYVLMCEYIGQCYNLHTNERFEITDKDIEYLIGINFETIPDKTLFLVMQQLGDEIIDPETVLSYYKGCETIIEQGGCHNFSGFPNHAQEIVSFLFARQV